MYQIEKTKSGFDLTIKTTRLAFLKAVFTGKLTTHLEKETAASVSNALYTPKKKKKIYSIKPEN